MKRHLFAAVLTAASLLVSPISATAADLSLPQIEYTNATASDPVSAERVAALVNNVRRQNGLSELKVFPLLSQAASVRAEELSRSFAHTRPNGEAFYSIVIEYGIPYGRVAENAAFGQATPEIAMKSWLNSDSHRKNLLNPDFNYIGVGAYYLNGVYYWDQLFIQASESMNGAETPKNIGDADLNGMLDAKDATLVLTDYARTSAGKSSLLNETQRVYADMNGDRMITAVDATAILTTYARSSTL